MFLLHIEGVEDPKKHNYRPWPGNKYTQEICARWFEILKPSPVWYYLLMNSSR